jgi:hypothetical protein
MMRVILAAFALFAAAGAAAQVADEFKLIKLEQDVRQLERQVHALQRQVEALRTRSGPSSAASAQRDGQPAQPASDAWLSAANWDRIRPGMSELEVIETLGPPASMRPSEDGRVLLYALEIGPGGFLSGSVTLKRREVVAVQRPVLK